MIDVAIFDDNKERHEALRHLINLQLDMQSTREYLDKSILLKNLVANRPHVVLINMEMEGVEKILRKVINYHPNTLIIMLTSFQNKEQFQMCLETGVHGYILKKEVDNKIIDSIREVVDGGSPMSPMIANSVRELFRKSNS